MAIDDTYRYRQALQFERSYQGLVEDIQTVALHSIAQTFIRNMNRVSALGTFPLILAYTSYSYGKIVSPIMIAEEASDNDNQEKIGRISDRINDALERELFSVADDNLDQKIHKGGSMLLNWLLSYSEQGGQDGIEATLSAMMVEAWAAFEALAEDLWVNAVDMSPSGLAYAFITKSHRRKSNTSDEPKRGDASQTIPLDILHRYKFDLRNKMGSMLDEQKKVTFDSLSTIKAAYLEAFGPGINKVFKRDDLSKAEAMRNVLAHRAGLVDKHFFRRMKGKVEYDQLKIGDKLPIDGIVVKDHVNSLVSASIDLLLYVDKWLQAHAS